MTIASQGCPSASALSAPTPSQRKDSIAQAAQALRNGKLVIFPTETVYGIGAQADNDQAIASIFAAKGRPRFNPLIVHVATLAAARRLGRLDPRAERLAAALWPGPLTLVVPRAEGCPASALVSAGLDTIALRMPAHPVARALAEQAGPIAAPSANRSGRLSPTRLEDALASLAGATPAPAAALDGGACTSGLESTVLLVREGAALTLLRPGGITRVRLEAVAGVPVATLADAADAEAARLSPGRLAAHYAPSKPLRMNAMHAAPGESWLGFGKRAARARWTLSPSGDLTEAAANLFRILHAMDAHAEVRAIAVAPIPDEGLGEAINDRLRRAARR